MKFVKVSTVIAIVATIILTGCYKFNHNYIMKGKWYVNSFEVEGGSSDLMEAVLPHNTNGDGQYMVYMLDNGLLRGEYYVSDTLYYFRTGTWNMPHKDSVTFDIDKFIKGTFLIEQVDRKAFLLTTDDNYIEFFNIGSVSTVMRISRGEYIDPALTKP